MVDNKPKEHAAESLIIHYLLENGFKLSKPSFDQEGADLLILDNITEKSTSFLKLQSKYRSFASDSNSSVTIPIKYVTENFVLFLYAGTDSGEKKLYTFFIEDIKRWRNKGENYHLTISERNLREYETNIFSKTSIHLLNEKLKNTAVKPYTSIIIDGIFLEKALNQTRTLYSKIWEAKEFKHPILGDIIKNILDYNRFPESAGDINCVLFISDYHHLESVVHIPDLRKTTIGLPHVKLSIHRSDQMIGFQVTEYLDRIINTENIILVADDYLYQESLNNLKDKGVDIIIVKQSTDLGSRLFTQFRWGDITYPIGLSLGLLRHEL
ncbi:hypothetical protein [Sphingobacterium hotanense]|uniref:hypothetical protein n=1 Tax=Sphingobacterium hotanense TaxID=649196 RepID=UPI0021A7625E|nr:hypothetical protein [Sphingobacterium hotanense]MCT1525654.1 hypothetical protein [Sphingobacterium hotanense]